MVLAEPRGRFSGLYASHTCSATTAPGFLPLSVLLGSLHPAVGAVGALRWLLYLSANQPEFMSFHDKAEAQEGADWARVDSWICTAANNGFPSSLSLGKVDSEQGRHQT